MLLLFALGALNLFGWLRWCCYCACLPWVNNGRQGGALVTSAPASTTLITAEPKDFSSVP
jgi:hypothetical protein